MIDRDALDSNRNVCAKALKPDPGQQPGHGEKDGIRYWKRCYLPNKPTLAGKSN